MAEPMIRPPISPPTTASSLSPALAGLGASEKAVATIRAKAVILFFIGLPVWGSLLRTVLRGRLFKYFCMSVTCFPAALFGDQQHRLDFAFPSGGPNQQGGPAISLNHIILSD